WRGSSSQCLRFLASSAQAKMLKATSMARFRRPAWCPLSIKGWHCAASTCRSAFLRCPVGGARGYRPRMNITVVVIFIGVVFAAVFLLMLGLTVSASGDSRMRRTLRRRLERIGADGQQDVASILREKYLTSLSPLERRLEELPFMQGLAERC